MSPCHHVSVLSTLFYLLFTIYSVLSTQYSVLSFKPSPDVETVCINNQGKNKDESCRGRIFKELVTGFAARHHLK